MTGEIDYAVEQLKNLTPREAEVFRHGAAGLTGVETARQLGISQRTVEAHRVSIKQKLRLRGWSQAALVLERALAGEGRPLQSTTEAAGYAREVAALARTMADQADKAGGCGTDRRRPVRDMVAAAAKG